MVRHCNWAPLASSPPPCSDSRHHGAHTQEVNFAGRLRAGQMALRNQTFQVDDGRDDAWLLARLLADDHRAAFPFVHESTNGVASCIRTCHCDDGQGRELWVVHGPNTSEPSQVILGIPKVGWTQLHGLVGRAAAALGAPGATDACCYSRSEQRRFFSGERRVPLLTLVRFPPARYLSAFLDIWTEHARPNVAKEAALFHQFVREQLFVPEECGISCSPPARPRGVSEDAWQGWAGHWVPQGESFGLHTLIFEHVWRIEDMPWVIEERTLGAAGMPKAAWCGGFGQASNLSFAESMRPAQYNSHGHHSADRLAEFWTASLFVGVLCHRSRRVETMLLWPLYTKEYLALATALGLQLELLLDVATGECRRVEE